MKWEDITEPHVRKAAVVPVVFDTIQARSFRGVGKLTRAFKEGGIDSVDDGTQSTLKRRKTPRGVGASSLLQAL